MSMLPLNLTPLVSFPSLTSRQGMIRLLSMASIPAAEVFKNPESEAAAFLGVKLDRHETAPRYGGGEPDAVLRLAENVRPVRRRRVVRVHKVELGVCGDPGKQRVASPELNTVPAHVRDFQKIAPLHQALGKPLDAAGNDAEAGRHVVFFAGIEDDLRSQADPEKGFARPGDFADASIETRFPE